MWFPVLMTFPPFGKHCWRPSWALFCPNPNLLHKACLAGPDSSESLLSLSFILLTGNETDFSILSLPFNHTIQYSIEKCTYCIHLALVFTFIPRPVIPYGLPKGNMVTRFSPLSSSYFQWWILGKCLLWMFMVLMSLALPSFLDQCLTSWGWLSVSCLLDELGMSHEPMGMSHEPIVVPVFCGPGF